MDLYREYSPCSQLSSYIDKYWVFKGNVTKGTRFNILPYGCTDFVFTLGGSLNTVENPFYIRPYRSYFVGNMTKFSTLVAETDCVHQFAIRFLPCGVASFIRQPLYELSNTRIHTADLQTIFTDTLTDILCEKETVEEQIAFIERFLQNYLYRNYYEVDKNIRYAVRQIDLSYGVLPIQNLVDKICLCQRHFERKFKQFTGFTPKEYSRIAQFKNAINLLRKPTFDSLLSVAIYSGYYDVPHLSREVKRLSGCTPNSFLVVPQDEDVTLTYVSP